MIIELLIKFLNILISNFKRKSSEGNKKCLKNFKLKPTHFSKYKRFNFLK